MVNDKKTHKKKCCGFLYKERLWHVNHDKFVQAALTNKKQEYDKKVQVEPTRQSHQLYINQIGRYQP